MRNKEYSYLHITHHVSRITSKGFSLIEMLVVIAIFTLILAFAINGFPKQKRNYAYQQYMSELETAVRMAKLNAIEKGANVSVCPVNNSIVVYNKGSDRSNPCNNAGSKIYSIDFDSSISVVKGNGFSFDPRGLGIVDGNICIQTTDASMHYIISVQSLSGNINIQKGMGGC